MTAIAIAIRHGPHRTEPDSGPRQPLESPTSKLGPEPSGPLDGPHGRGCELLRSNLPPWKLPESRPTQRCDNWIIDGPYAQWTLEPVIAFLALSYVDRDFRDILAIPFVLDRARTEGHTPLLVTRSKREQDASDAVRDFAAIYPSTTQRGSHRTRPRPGGGPVLALVPDFKLMELASFEARGSLLLAVEAHDTPLIGWAMETKAIDITTGQITPDTRTDEQRELLDQIHFNGNNGWADRPAARDAQRILQELMPRQGMTTAIVLGYMIARGSHAESVLRLETTVAKVVRHDS